MKSNTVLVLLILSVILYSQALGEDGYPYKKDTSLIGAPVTYKVKKGESLIEIIRKFDLGYNETVAANPRLAPSALKSGASITMPTFWILPDEAERKDIVINLSEMRLYYFFEEKKTKSVITFPIGIGTEGRDTPVGRFSIIEKIENPSWHVPESIRKEKPDLPKVVPPGPNNPLGSHALRLSLGDILIHGTDQPWSIGRRISHGCIRLYPEDIPKLFGMAQKGAEVAIIHQPIKTGIKDGEIYIEVHSDDTMKDLNYFDAAVVLLCRKSLIKDIDLEKLYSAASQRSGVPVKISGEKTTAGAK